MKIYMITEPYREHQYVTCMARNHYLGPIERVVAQPFTGPKGRLLGIAQAHANCLLIAGPVLILDDDVALGSMDFNAEGDVLILGAGAYVVFETARIRASLLDWMGLPIGNFWEFRGCDVRYTNIARKI